MAVESSQESGRSHDVSSGAKFGYQNIHMILGETHFLRLSNSKVLQTSLLSGEFLGALRTCALHRPSL